jgi:hypothetical protein
MQNRAVLPRVAGRPAALTQYIGRVNAAARRRPGDCRPESFPTRHKKAGPEGPGPALAIRMRPLNYDLPKKSSVVSSGEGSSASLALSNWSSAFDFMIERMVRM